MKYRYLFLFTILILTIGFIGFFLKTHAENANKGLVVYPTNFDLTYENQPTEGKITVLNNNEQAITLQTDLRNFTASGEEGGVALTQENTTFSLASWVTVSPKQVTLQPHTSQVFTFTITPPKNAEPGGHFGSIVFSTIPSKDIKGTAGASISQEIASLVLFKIPGDTLEQANVESFTTDKNFYEFGPVTMTTRVKNTGDIHIIPVGQIVVKGTFGDRYYIQLEPRNVLPNAIRQIPAVLSKKLLIGQYTATLIGTYGTKNLQLNGATQFYAFPIRYGAIVLGILLVVFLLRKRLWKAMKALITGK